MDRLFVYGSLKAGGEAHHLLDGCTREADGLLSQARLIVQNGYPMLIPGTGSVHGQVYRIPPERWPGLHAWEGVPTDYACGRRQLDDGRWVWVYQQPNH
ncbi:MULTISPECIES: gamma-glutamylcyclotransferase [unclassified Synechococcus]|uniref:gamma-glutamylcyclotransferase family protein n=1 Tax=unclassified Synechococcus TaxID=2626047 RepID=UPI0016478741|nr:MULTISPECIES: gamma-glutamylcyclotransferase family protein [unclassified Synechococcus]MEC7248300.1 gamma-glutamylcyclotransferase family protein [Cyanobacteriota bacterium]